MQNEINEVVLTVIKTDGTLVWLPKSEVDAQGWRYAELGDNRVSEIYEAPIK